MARISWMVGAAMTVILGAARADQPLAIARNMSAAAPAEARIAFSSRNIWNWEVLDEQTILIQSNSRKWYKAKLFGTCSGLRFVEQIGFKANADDSFDKFSAIELRGGQRCPLASLTESEAPARKAKKNAASSTDPAKP